MSLSLETIKCTVTGTSLSVFEYWWLLVLMLNGTNAATPDTTWSQTLGFAIAVWGFNMSLGFSMIFLYYPIPDKDHRSWQFSVGRCSNKSSGRGFSHYLSLSYSAPRWISADFRLLLIFQLIDKTAEIKHFKVHKIDTSFGCRVWPHTTSDAVTAQIATLSFAHTGVIHKCSSTFGPCHCTHFTIATSAGAGAANSEVMWYSMV